MHLLSRSIALGSLTLLLLAPAVSQAQYEQINLVTNDQSVNPAAFTDPNLVNPWGISASGGSPFWISDNHSGVTTLYNTAGQLITVPGTPGFITIPPPSGGTPPSAPTGTIFNGTTDFNVAPNTPARFIFSTEGGTIDAWSSGANAIQEADNSPSGAVYKGLANGSTGGNNYLYATDFHNGKIDVFDGSFAAATLAGSFTDPNVPAHYAPFNIQNIGGLLYVTYAKQLGPDNMDDDKGPGHGFIDVFNPDGTFVKRLATGSDAGGTLTEINSPWGLVKATSSFGQYANDLLVGNFGDGRINAFDSNGSLVGQLMDANGNPITIDGLWALRFGNGGSGGLVNNLYFTAGPNDETDGLFGTLIVVPEPSAFTPLMFGTLSLVGLLLRRRKG